MRPGFLKEIYLKVVKFKSTVKSVEIFLVSDTVNATPNDVQQTTFRYSLRIFQIVIYILFAKF